DATQFKRTHNAATVALSNKQSRVSAVSTQTPPLDARAASAVDRALEDVELHDALAWLLADDLQNKPFQD
ncbi:MAG: hypothetical protein QF918_14290, partial [Pirellulaceae bacterium]|nr:hypothetical protein [Pirellulaceae bacterium]